MDARLCPRAFPSWREVSSRSPPPGHPSLCSPSHALQEVDRYLSSYETLHRYPSLWLVFEAEILTSSVYRWREEAEKQRRDRGEPAMTEEQVRATDLPCASSRSSPLDQRLRGPFLACLRALPPGAALHRSRPTGPQRWVCETARDEGQRTPCLY
jgi:hypothetical protein